MIIADIGVVMVAQTRMDLATAVTADARPTFY